MTPQSGLVNRSLVRSRLTLLAAGAPAVLLAAAAMPAWASTVWSWLLLVLGFSLVIFVHELGHFAAAKWAKVRVDRFAIGFGKELFGFTRGETRYSFNALPLGGYVKMLGQEDFVVDKSGELKVKDNPDSFTSKSVGKRMVIISAGVIMNLIFAAVAFAVVVMVGRRELPAVVGQVVENMPAARAGLQTGDRIVAINGDTVETFNDLSARITLSDPNEELVLDVIRDGRPLEPKPRILPEFREDQMLRQIGVSPGMNLRVVVPGVRTAGQPAENELHRNDKLSRLRVGGEAKPLKDLGAFRRAIVEARGEPVEIVVERPDDPEGLSDEALMGADADIPAHEVRVEVSAMWLPIPYDPSDRTGGSLLGLVPRLTVLAVEPDKSFERAGVLPGDVIARIGDAAFPDYATLKSIIEANDGSPVAIEVSRPDAANGALSAEAVRFCVRHREALIRAAMDGVDGAVAEAEKRMTEAGLPKPDRMAILDELRALKDAASWRRWLEAVDVHALEPIVPNAPFALFNRPPPTVDAVVRCIDEPGVVVSAVRRRLGDRLSPAAAAGIPAGAVIFACDDRPIHSWNDLSRAFAAQAGKEVTLRYRLIDRLLTATFHVPPCISATLGLPPDARIVAIDGQSAFEIPTGEDRTQAIALPDWRAVAAGLKARIGKTVRVEYVTFEGSHRTADYAVTSDNTDPWMHRVFYEVPFACYPLVERHRVANPIVAAGVGFKKAYQATIQTVQSIRHMLITRQVGLSKVQGPVGIFRRGSQIAQGGTIELLWFLAIISANLAVINFLPLPIVDGGLMLFLILEKIRGEPVSIKTQVATQIIGIALIATVFLLVTYQDIKNWITGT